MVKRDTVPRFESVALRYAGVLLCSHNNMGSQRRCHGHDHESGGCRAWVHEYLVGWQSWSNAVGCKPIPTGTGVRIPHPPRATPFTESPSRIRMATRFYGLNTCLSSRTKQVRLPPWSLVIVMPMSSVGDNASPTGVGDGSGVRLPKRERFDSERERAERCHQRRRARTCHHARRRSLV